MRSERGGDAVAWSSDTKGPANYAPESALSRAGVLVLVESNSQSFRRQPPGGKSLPFSFLPQKASPFPRRASPCRAISRSRGRGAPGGGAGLMALDAGTWDGGHATLRRFRFRLPKRERRWRVSRVRWYRLRGPRMGQGCILVPSYPRGILAHTCEELCATVHAHWAGMGSPSQSTRVRIAGGQTRTRPKVNLNLRLNFPG